MITRRHALLTAALLATVPAASTPTAQADTARIDPTTPDWVLVPSLSDDFTTLDEGRWRRGLWYPGSDLHTFEPGAVEADGGTLRLWARPSPGGPRPYSFGAVESRFDVPGVSSYVEVRARCLDRSANVLSALWMQSSTLTGEDRLLAEPSPEIDIQENLHDTSVDWAHHLWPWDGRGHRRDDAPRPGGTHQAGEDLTAGHHLYGCERRDGHVRLYLDRVLYADIDCATLPPRFSALARMSRHVVLSLEAHRGQPAPAALPASFDIDYVRTYSHAPSVTAARGTLTLTTGDGRTLAVRDGRVVATTEADPGTDTWALTQHDDLTFSLSTPTGLVLRQASAAGTDGTPLEVTATAGAPTGPDDAGSLARWHVHGTRDSLQVLNKVSGLPLRAPSSRRGPQPVAVGGSGGAPTWTARPATTTGAGGRR